MNVPVPHVGRACKVVVLVAALAALVAGGRATPTFAVGSVAPPSCPSGGNLYPVTYPVVSGSATVGGVLTTTNGTWRDSVGNPASPFRYLYQWYSDGTAITGATLQSYTVTAGDAAHLVYVAVSANSGAGTCGLWGTANSNAVDINAESDEIGTMEEDQSTETGDDSTSAPAAPAPMTPTGPAAAAAYTTEVWNADATETDDGLKVVATSAIGTTALTGTVVADTTEAAIAGATVSMQCATACSIGPVSTTTEANGTFAFTSMPVATYNLTISAPGFGTYSILNDPYEADTTYTRVAFMTAAAQTSDMAGYADAPADAATAEAVDLPGTSFSQRRVPPSIRVAMADVYPRGSGARLFCTLRSGSADTAPIRRFSWDFYISHVVAPELGPSLTRQFGQYGLKSFSALVQNFAWFHKTKPGPYDVTNIGGGYAGQCFRLDEKVRVAQWSSWFADVRDERIVNANDQLMLTQYQQGTTPGFCSDPGFAVHNGSQASQYGILAHVLAHQPGQPTTTACQMTDWRALAVLYYPTTWKLVSGLRPPTATGSYSTSAGTVTLSFRARVFGQNVAWKFYLQKRTSTGWHTFKVTRWSSRSRDVVQTYSFSPPSGCVKYRVKAVNPVNDPAVHGAAALANTPAGQFTPKGIGISPTGQCTL